MHKLVIYSEKNAFDDIAVFEKHPNLRNIFVNNAEIILNISQADFDAEISAEGELFHFVHANAGAEIPKPYQAPFQNIIVDSKHILDDPRGLYVLNINDAESKRLQSEFGIIVLSSSAIDDNIVSNFSFMKELLKDEVYDDGTNLGWKNLLSINLPPSNSIIISDPYLFNDIESLRGTDFHIGVENVIQLMDKLLPSALTVDYQVSIIAECKGKTQNTKSQIVGRLSTEINNLRPYNINVEVVFVKSEHIHKRRLIMNYVNGSVDKGFSVFKVRDKKTVRAFNDIRLNSVFSSKTQNYGDTEFHSATEGLNLIKKECADLALYLQTGNVLYKGSIMGGCKANWTLSNRLIN